jgi:Uma2 family endonuclease
MAMLVLDRDDQKRILRERREAGVDRFDEVWDGVYVVGPVRDNEHQLVITELTFAIGDVLDGTARIYAGVNVSDRETGWKKNYRIPDVAVYLPSNPALDRKTHWLGGPDFVAEVLTPSDRARKKFGFYAEVGVREVLLVDRRPWRLELYRWSEMGWIQYGWSDLERPDAFSSAVLPLTFRLLPGEPRPQIAVTKTGGNGRWLV